MVQLAEAAATVPEAAAEAGTAATEAKTVAAEAATAEATAPTAAAPTVAAEATAPTASAEAATAPATTSAAEEEDHRDCYNMRSNPQGICLIVNNINFQCSRILAPSVDNGRLLVGLFQELDFKVEVKRDLSVAGIMATAKEFASKDLSHFDAFVFYILSHGNENDVINVIDQRAISV